MKLSYGLGYILSSLVLFTQVTSIQAATIQVPQQYSTIQSAISAAATGDTIMVAPGTYTGAVTLNKAVTLQATVFDQADPRRNSVIIDGSGTSNGVITIPSGVSGNPKVSGFVLRNGESGTLSNSPYTVEYTYFTNIDGDQAEYEKGSGGINRNNVYFGAGDDAIDLDNQVADLLIENNLMLQSGQDGIEIRLQDDSIANLVTITIRGNRIEESGADGDGDGIQIIDYDSDTNRRYIIERNLFLNNTQSGIGLMCCENTIENYQAASIREEIKVINNTFVGNNHGITGGDDMLVLNNIFINTTNTALKNVDNASRISNNLFWQNGTDFSGTTVMSAVIADPKLDATYQLQAGSPAIDNGVAAFAWTNIFGRDANFLIPASQYTGAIPDLGWKEAGTVAPTSGITVTPHITPIPSGAVGTNLSLTLLLHGLGKGGDNVNANAIGTLNPTRINRQVSIELINASNQTTLRQGIVTYNGSSGNFQGVINGQGITAGIYILKVSTPQYLKKIVPGIINISTSQTTQIPSIALTTGDINSDNALSVNDYNLILDCFSDFGQPRNCADANKKLMADITDDGAVNQFDYNLFVRELSVQSGAGGNNPTPIVTIPAISTYPTPILSLCFLQAGPISTLSGVQTSRYDARSNLLAASTKIDARNAVWKGIHDYPVIVAGGSGICFYGGTIEGLYSQDATWDTMHGTTAMEVRNNLTTVEKTRIHNYGDGISMKDDGADFKIKGVYLSYIRDDCIENDYLHSGLVEDSLFDGCYEAFSARTHSGQDPKPEGSNNLWTIRNNLIRLQPMKKVYKDRGIIPGHDGFFKWDDSGVSPQLSLRNNIFRADQNANNVGLGIPPGKLIDCADNTMVWLGSGSYPETLPSMLSGRQCFTITTDKTVWDNAVNTWKAKNGY